MLYKSLSMCSFSGSVSSLLMIRERNVPLLERQLWYINVHVYIDCKPSMYMLFANHSIHVYKHFIGVDCINNQFPIWMKE